MYLFRNVSVTTIEANRREPIVTRQNQLWLLDPFGKRQCLAIRLLRLLKLALALMDLPHHDERYRKMIQLPQLAIEIDRCMRRLEPFCFAPIGESAIRGREVPYI